jgi:hypothetical protein
MSILVAAMGTLAFCNLISIIISSSSSHFLAYTMSCSKSSLMSWTTNSSQLGIIVLGARLEIVIKLSSIAHGLWCHVAHVFSLRTRL